MCVNMCSMKPELTSLTKRLEILTSLDPYGVDFTFEALRRGLVEVIAAFPVYRTYIGEDGKITKEDEEVVARAMKHARTLSDPETDPKVLDFIERTLLAQSNEVSSTPPLLSKISIVTCPCRNLHMRPCASSFYSSSSRSLVSTLR